MIVDTDKLRAAIRWLEDQYLQSEALGIDPALTDIVRQRLQGRDRQRRHRLSVRTAADREADAAERVVENSVRR